MNCFQHSNKVAIGHCTFCGRGLCPDCASDVEGKLTCRGTCRQQVERERRLFAQSEMAAGDRSVVYETSSAVYQRSFAFSAVAGLLFTLFGIALLLGQMPVGGAALTGLGIVFLINGLGMARASKKFKALATRNRVESTPS